MFESFLADATIFSTLLVFVFGTIIGSFLNVVIYRLHTGRTLGGSSHCLSCGRDLRWYELFPIVSYLALRARCYGCGSYIPPRYFIVELLMGGVYVFLWQTFASAPWLFLLYGALAALLMVVAVYDIRHTIIPDEFTVGVLIVALFVVGYEVVLAQSVTPVFPSIVGGVVASLFFWGLWRISHGRWIGLGDAKLAFPLGVMVSYPDVFNMIMFSFWVGAVVSLVLMGVARLLRRGKTRMLFFGSHLTMKSEVPFAPFLIIGFLLVIFFHANIFAVTLWFFGF